MTIFKNNRFPLSPARFLRALSMATIIPVLVMIIAMIARPLWRDEYWALYFSDIHHSLEFLLTQRLSYDTHPPLYFIIIHFWRAVIDHVLWIKLFSILCLVLSGFSIWKLQDTPINQHPGENAGQPAYKTKFETLLFFLLCLGSYWVIYFMAEIRPYIMLFSLCALSVFIVKNLADKIGAKTPLTIIDFALWALLGAAISLSHYYGAIWVGLCGAGLGIWAWLAKRPRTFFAFAAATMLALLPVTMWILNSFGTINFGQEIISATDLFTAGAHQFLRALFGKTLVANIGLTIMVCIGLPIWWRRKTPADLILMLACIGLVLTVFFVHVFIQPFIKERAFLVIIPALIFMMARSIGHAVFENRIGSNLQKAALTFAVLTPLLFWSEFFKDREKISHIRAVFTQDTNCRTAPIATYFRPSPQGDDFSAFYINRALANLYGPNTVQTQPQFLDITKIDPATVRAIMAHDCSVKILTMNLRRGDRRSSKSDHVDFRHAVQNFIAMSSKPTKLEHTLIGKGRNQIYRLSPKQTKP